jgi:prevent-host-death family protein
VSTATTNTPATWQLQEAKNRLSALIDAVEDGSDQIVTRHGEPVAVVVPYATWLRWQGARLGEPQTLYDAMRAAAPLGGLPDPPPRPTDPTGRIPDFSAPDSA